MNFKDKWQKQFEAKKSFLCVGLDTDLALIPERFRKEKNPLLAFNLFIIEQTAPFAVAYKPNLAFYERYGEMGYGALKETCQALNKLEIPVILDAKRGDIGNTAQYYAQALFDMLGGDAATLAPYMGFDSIGPFAAYGDKVSFVLGLTSNASASDFELLTLEDKSKLYEKVIATVKNWRLKHPNRGLVIGATQEEELKTLSSQIQGVPLLVPGVGAQGGSLEAVIKYLYRSNMLFINSSRGIIYATNPALAARELTREMQQWAKL
ncbi:MAG: orotidine-5'-phosphate decarboxylase [Spirochaetae bacterium HGW-Spirochaetae-6]|nr:MAG: orotidine-5'-phosphate decarboxylase [Spirochaetae bacterium HGW-Spirochaetae-6]